MGSFIEICEEKAIEDHPSEELAERMEYLFRCGGMMKFEFASLFGMKIITLKRSGFEKIGKRVLLNCNYNYFDNEFWEDAGYNAESGHVYSDKVGGNFAMIVYAAYMLESLYSRVPIIPLYNGRYLTPDSYFGWINYLFDENYTLNNKDSFSFFRYVYHNCPDYQFDKRILTNDIDCYIGAFYTYIMLYGFEEAFDTYERQSGKKIDSDTLSVYNICRKMFDALNTVHSESNLDKQTQLEVIKEYIKKAYSCNDIPKEVEDLMIKRILITTLFIDEPLLTVKAISEVYGVDFEELYHEIEPYYLKRCSQFLSEPIKKCKTSEFLKIADDDMLPYWTKGGDIRLSDEMNGWLTSLKKRFDSIVSYTESPHYSLREIFRLLYDANKKHRNIFVFESFLEETVENLSDKRIQALWLLFEQLSSETNEDYDIIQKKLRNHLAVCGNRELRKSVFGF